jgi:hypothetical protein
MNQRRAEFAAADRAYQEHFRAANRAMAQTFRMAEASYASFMHSLPTTPEGRKMLFNNVVIALFGKYDFIAQGLDFWPKTLYYMATYGVIGAVGEVYGIIEKSGIDAYAASVDVPAATAALAKRFPDLISADSAKRLGLSASSWALFLGFWQLADGAMRVVLAKKFGIRALTQSQEGVVGAILFAVSSILVQCFTGDMLATLREGGGAKLAEVVAQNLVLGALCSLATWAVKKTGAGLLGGGATVAVGILRTEATALYYESLALLQYGWVIWSAYDQDKIDRDRTLRLHLSGAGDVDFIDAAYGLYYEQILSRQR